MNKHLLVNIKDFWGKPNEVQLLYIQIDNGQDNKGHFLWFVGRIRHGWDLTYKDNVFEETAVLLE